MKKYLFLLAGAAMLSISAVSAQKTQYNAGVKAGVNVASLSSVSGGMKVGPVVGVLIEGTKPGGLSLGGELLFSWQGYYSGSNRMTFSYIILPVMANWTVTDGLMLKAGIQPGALLNVKRKYNGESVKYNDPYSNIDFSIPVGISYTDRTGAMIELRYSHGLTDVLKNEGSNKNRVISLTVGYKF